MKHLYLLLIPILFLSGGSGFSAEVSLSEILVKAEKFSHLLSAAQLNETAARANVGLARSDYFPTLDFEAVDSTGFAASSNLSGITGIPGSPYRKGASLGAVSRINIWDFGRTFYSTESASYEANVEKYRSQITEAEVDLEAAKTFFDCVRTKTQMENWQIILDQARVVSEEVQKYIATGQRSVVDKYLSESQVEEAFTQKADFEKKSDLEARQLSILTGIDYAEISCPILSKLSKIDASAISDNGKNPDVLVATEQAHAEEARASHAKAERLPKLFAGASAGIMQDVRLVREKNYSIGIGLEIPLFEVKAYYKIKRAEALSSGRQFLIEAAKERVDQTNAKYDKIILSSQARLEHLQNELKLAEEGFQIAKRRYFKFQGTLVDVRETLRNLTRTRIQIDDSQIDFMEASAAKILFNGRTSILKEGK
ncbi:MAG: Outer rane efflux protein [Bacteriovoracaceae bacterium]|nr:Outer rane efflux protein [Bacteriovoracaceae bacterium]